MLPEGFYTLFASSKGFEAKQQNIQVPERQTRDVNFALKPVTVGDKIDHGLLSPPDSPAKEKEDRRRLAIYPFDSFYYPRKLYGELKAKTKNLVDFYE